jgi:hypothetical protein
MCAAFPPDIAALHEAFAEAERDARRLAEGLTDAAAGWRPSPSSWSVAECLDHLATTNRVYLEAMEPSAARALASGRRRRGPAIPGIVGGWFVRMQEPPVKRRARMKAPGSIRPRHSPPFGDAMAAFFASQDAVRTFLRTYAGLDLAGTRFPNPFIRGIRFSLATGLHVIAAHERRHLWQAHRIREAATVARG